MPRNLTQDEIANFLTGTPQAASDIQALHASDSGTPSLDWLHTGPLAYPLHGVAYKYTDHYVLVWLDADSQWHFIDLSDKPELAQQVNNPPYFSPNGDILDAVTSFWQHPLDAAISAVGHPLDSLSSGLTSLADGTKNAIGSIWSPIQGELDVINAILIIALVGVVVILIVGVYRGFEVPGLKVGKV